VKKSISAVWFIAVIVLTLNAYLLLTIIFYRNGNIIPKGVSLLLHTS
jgi:hypothetical protein